MQESVQKRGNRPCFFYSIVTHAIDVLAALIERIREQFKRIAALLDKKDNAESSESAKSVPVVESSATQTKNAFAQVEEDVVTVSQKPESEERMANVPQAICSSETKEKAVSDSAEVPKGNEPKTIDNLKSQKDIIPPRPEFAMSMEKYEKLQEIYKKLVRQENAVLTCEKELELLQQELLSCASVFQGKPRKGLQGQIADKEQQIADKEQQIANTKQRLGDIVRGHGYSIVDAFMAMYRKVETDYADYTKRLKEWVDKYGMKYVEQRFEQQQKSFEADINKIKYRSNLS